MTNLNNGFLQHSCLILLRIGLSFTRSLSLILINEGHWTGLVNIFGRGNKRILRDKSHLFNHSFKRIQYKALCILCKHNWAYRKNHNNEKCSYYLDRSFSVLGGLGAICDRKNCSILRSDRIPSKFLFPQRVPDWFPLSNKSFIIPFGLIVVRCFNIYQWVNLFFTPCLLNEMLIRNLVLWPLFFAIVVDYLQMI